MASTCSYVTLFICLLFASYGLALQCLECKDMPNPEACRTVTTCSGISRCYVEQFVTSGGLVLYNLGCLSPERCKMKRSIVQRRQDTVSSTDLATCVECCDGNGCNIEGCGTKAVKLPQRAPICFTCESQEDQTSCRDVSICEDNHVCGLYKIYSVGDEYLWRSQCLPLAQCDHLSNSGNLCVQCCRDDFCNNNCHQNITSTLQTHQTTTHYPQTTQHSTVNHPQTTQHSTAKQPQTTQHSTAHHAETTQRSTAHHAETTQRSTAHHAETTQHSTAQHLETIQHSTVHQSETTQHSTVHYPQTTQHSTAHHVETTQHSTAQHLETIQHSTIHHPQTTQHSTAHNFETTQHSTAHHPQTTQYSTSHHSETTLHSTANHLETTQHSTTHHSETHPTSHYPASVVIHSTSGLSLTHTPFPKKECRNNSVDLCFVFDSSGSLGPDLFSQELHFAIVALHKIFQNNTHDLHVCVITYSTVAHLDIPLANYTLATDKLINAIPFRDGETYTHLALKELVHEFQTHGRPNADKVAVLLTDGMSDNPSATLHQANLLKGYGIELYAVGFGQHVDQNELHHISQYSVFLPNIHQLDLVHTHLLETICQ